MIRCSMLKELIGSVIQVLRFRLIAKNAKVRSQQAVSCTLIVRQTLYSAKIKDRLRAMKRSCDVRKMKHSPFCLQLFSFLN